MGSHVLDVTKLDQTHAAIAGGKAANLGELARISGVRVPPGFCVTTHAFRQAMALDAEGLTMPADVAAEIAQALARDGDRAAYAVRSSATAEDSATASFAGQYETFLNVVGTAAIVDHVRRCWLSLFSERAVTYRRQNGVDDRTVSMAVVVQHMVFPRAAGVLFTADPVSGNRSVSAIDASLGLGEALVSGLTNADSYRVRDGKIVAKTIASKHVAIDASHDGGTERRAIDAAKQHEPALTDAEVVRLAEIGRRIEAHFGRPQDIEWCLVDDDFQIVQSRPITTLFPIPARDDDEKHVYISVGHQQMMTDAMKPLGISMWQLTAAGPMFTAGGRIFVDVARALASPAGRAGLLGMAGKSDPLVGDALRGIIDRGFIPSIPDAAPAAPPQGAAAPPPTPPPIETDPAIVRELIARSEASIDALKRDIAGKSGAALLDFILADIPEGKRILTDPRGFQVFMSAMEATWWLNEHLEKWLGEKNVADTLSLSVPNNVTSEMGLALLDVADVIRPHQEVVAFLERVGHEDFLDELASLDGGKDARDALVGWLDKYGMRGPGEIDITRPRWRERPRMLLPLLLGHVRNFAAGEATRRFADGLRTAQAKERDVLARLRALPDGEAKADETKRKIDRVRTFIGYREYPKYGKIRRDSVYRQALLEEAERLARAGVLRDAEDMFFLTFQEVQEVERTRRVDDRLIRDRKEAFRSFQSLTPPRVFTSEGEVVTGSYRRTDFPEGALVGLPVSSGMIEGRARVALGIDDAKLEPGDILVTTFTDPSWTPLFVAIKGLVTEVGGLMTHGAVIAREYGLPAVVGVENATRLIRDGQRIRVHGTEGYVELLP
jgi:pyruvate,water dikinase